MSTLGMQQVEVNQTIDYTYDPLNRLTGAAYDDGNFYQYTYNAVGNRLTETTPTGTGTYIYNINNWVVQKNDTSWSYDPAGNLRSDGFRSYEYDAANRLKWVSDRSAYVQTSYAYNGLGDRLQSTLLYYPTGESTTTNYTLDLNTNLTQVLADGSNTYTYGYNRIAQVSNTQTGYFLGDALSSVRQVADETGEVNLVQSYSPYGEVISSVGDYVTSYSYTGEMTDGTGLVFLRARYYDPAMGRFVNKDTWAGDYNNPVTLAKWLYANANPVVYVDRSGFISKNEVQEAEAIVTYLKNLNINIVVDWGLVMKPDPRNPKKDKCLWSEGRWTLNELYIVKGAVQNLNRAMNQKISFYVGSVQISKVPSSSFPPRCSGAIGCTSSGNNIQLVDNNNPPKTDADPSNLADYYITGSGNTTNFSQWVVVHELAHVWENYNKSIVGGTSSLSLELVAATGGVIKQSGANCNNTWEPGCNSANYFYGGIPARGSNINFTPAEDFAESVAAYVFPKESQAFVNQFYLDPNKEKYLYYPDYTKTDRWKFINGILNQKP